ncbi:MAG: hypothetical protein C4297_13865 [Gemmataceae bacterium]
MLRAVTRLVLMSSASILVGCSSSSDFPQPGDTVKPSLTRPIAWVAGQKGELWADVRAITPQGQSRRLSFRASPNNPIARVTFYAQDGSLLEENVYELGTRC